jgi:NAD(P)-dependent dehydrogenase (short-subunit alcohol dehydrogenase family)
MLLANKVAIVTGGARGIGRAIAVKYAREGSAVIVVDTRTKEALETIRQISNINNKGLLILCDSSNSSQVKKMVDQVIASYGKIDILVNDAVISPPENSIPDICEEEWDRVLALNLEKVFICCKAVLPYMKKQKSGKIINITSVGITSAAAAMHDDSVAESGIVKLSQSLALEAKSFNICVNALVPGDAHTKHDGIGCMPGDEHFSRTAKISPITIVADPQDIAGVALFLASEISRDGTGDRIFATGGLQFNSGFGKMRR